MDSLKQIIVLKMHIKSEKESGKFCLPVIEELTSRIKKQRSEMKDWLKQARDPCNKYSGVGGEGLPDRPPRLNSLFSIQSMYFKVILEFVLRIHHQVRHIVL